MSIFGLSPLGTGAGPFGGPGLISVLGVLPTSNNTWTVVFDVAPKADDTQSPASATNERNFVLEALDPTIVASDGTTYVPPGAVVPTRFPYTAAAAVDEADPTQVLCWSDSPLQTGVRYRVTVQPELKGAACETFAGPTQFEFVAPAFSGQLTPVLVSAERYRDFDYIVNPGPGEVGLTYRLEASGDIGIQDAPTSLRKRIYRRVFSDPGAFAWAPGYGVGMSVKSLAKAQRLQELSNLIAAQIQREPDVASAGVEVFVTRTEQGTFVEVACYVQQRDARTRTFTFREAV